MDPLGISSLGPQIQLGTLGAADYMIIGAYNNVNNIDTKARPLYMFNSAGITLFYGTTGGNVGIGTLTPNARLHTFSNDSLNTMFVENNGGGNATQGALRVKVNAASASRNILQLENNSSTVMIVRDDGNVGIGTTQPATGFSTTIPNAKLSILSGVAGNNGGASRLSIGGDNSHYSAIEGAHTANGSTTLAFMTCTNATTNSGNPLTRMFIDANGNVGIGSTSPQNTLHIHNPSGSSDVRMIVSDATTTVSSSRGLHLIKNASQNAYLWNYENGSMQFGTNNASVMTILPGGNVGIGTASPSYTLQVAGTVYASGDVISYSDQRVKTEIAVVDNALDKVSQMRGVYFTNTQTQKRGVGVIAQEIQTVLPEVIEDKAEYLGVAYGNIVGVLIEAIKELKTKLANLENDCKCNCSCSCNTI